MACVYCQIKDLTQSSHSFFITTLIIAKTEAKFFNSNRPTGVITFTVRDTKNHFINCSVWGSEQFIRSCVRVYNIGDIISIYQPTVLQKNQSSNYHPRTTSPFELKVKEGKSYIHRAMEQPDHLLRLRKQAVKPTSLALKLDDLICNPGSEVFTADVVVLGKYSGNKILRKIYLFFSNL